MPRPTDTIISNTIIQRNIPTRKGGTLEMRSRNDVRIHVLSGVPLQPPRRLPEAKVSPINEMPEIGQTWLHLPEGCHGIGESGGLVQRQIP